MRYLFLCAMVAVTLLLLLGCATSPLFHVEQQGVYPKAIDKSKWALTPYKVYVSRDTDFEANPIPYKVLYDNTAYKKALAEKFETDENFKKYVATFILHEGKVNCKIHTNVAKVTQYDDKMTVLRVEDDPLYSEASDFICLILKAKK